MKILFLQYWYDMFGGAETVNDTLIRQFIKDGYDAQILCLWSGGNNEIIKDINYNKQVINNKPQKKSYKKAISKLLTLKFKSAYKDIKVNIKYYKKVKEDLKMFSNKIKDINPDFIIVTNYELIKYVPHEYLSKSVLHMHSGFKAYLEGREKKRFKIVKKYENKINKIIWLTPTFKNSALENGFKNSEYIYNPVRFESNEVSNLNSKTITFIGRLSPVKRVDLLSKIVNKLNNDYILNIYGSGDTKNIENSDKVILKGSTNNVKEVLMTSSILALTSSSEGFPMVILESYECGVPVIACNFGDSTYECIKDKETGFVINNDNEEEYINKLNLLCNDSELRKKMGQNAKKYVKQFQSETVVKRWYKLFKGEL